MAYGHTEMNARENFFVELTKNYPVDFSISFTNTEAEGIPKYGMHSDVSDLEVHAEFLVTAFSNGVVQWIETALWEARLIIHYENSLYDSYDNHKFSEGDLFEGHFEIEVQKQHIENDTVGTEKSWLDIEIDMHDTKDVDEWTVSMSYHMKDNEDE